MVGLVRTSNQFNGWGHALAFDGEIKGWVTPKSGPRTPNPIALSAMLCTRGAYSIYTPALQHTELAQTLEGKKECLVGFNSREAGRGGGFCFTSVGWQGLAHSSTKGSRQSPPDPFAYTSIPQFVLVQTR